MMCQQSALEQTKDLMFHATSNKSNILSQNSCSDTIHHIHFCCLMEPYLFQLSTANAQFVL